eukprot:TRINITY_DN1676_c0_g1_i3.p1 TRINITY_DN1676_c0_g1~~TRINITY_DN1676_c0_g1_i3.p1  ORF type:complete len:453 (-),score=86.63 TRINITY_DN1676_c0_g1_i3:60-1418(-)
MEEIMGQFPCLFCDFVVEQESFSSPSVRSCISKEEEENKKEIEEDRKEKEEEERKEEKGILFDSSYFGLTEEAKKLLQHLLIQHHLIIADSEKIAYLPGYLSYWKRSYIGKPICEYASTIDTQPTTSQGTPQKYYLLGDILPEDAAIRVKLQNERLEYLLKKHQEERKCGHFRKQCLFCNKFFCERKDYFSHMFDVHSFNVGLPENLVNVDRFLEILREKIRSHICVYCEKTYSSMAVLKMHMRKKKHFKINGKNKIYDPYYIINYLENGKNWEAIQSETDDSEDESQESVVEQSKNDNWDEWNDVEENDVKCLFCRHCTNLIEILDHMNIVHEFSTEKMRTKMNLNFYECIRAANFIRKQVNDLKCPTCGEQFKSEENLNAHLRHLNHCGVTKDSSFWKDDSYLIPFLKDDPFLRSIESLDSDEEDEEKVIGEEVDMEHLASNKNLLLDCI